MDFIKRNSSKFKELEISMIDKAEDSLRFLEKKYCFTVPKDFERFHIYLDTHEFDSDFDTLETKYMKDMGFKYLGIQSIYWLPKPENIDSIDPQIAHLSGYCIPYSYPGDIHSEEHYEAIGKYPENWTPSKKNDYMVIASTSGSDYVLLGIGGKDTYGKVYLWQFHESEKYNPYLLADSFGEFIDGIFEWDYS